MDKKRREAIRYLGFGRNAADERTYELIEASFDDLNRETSPRFVYRIFDLDHSVDGLLRVGTMEIQSKSLLRNLKGCGQVVLFGATLGAGVDRLIRRVSLTDMARAVVLDSFASVAVEQVCQKVDEILAEKYSGKYMTFRFSPGYGDYPIEMQKEYLRILDAPRKIGLTTGDSCLLVPSKSVTAVLGISDNPIERRKRGCAICSMKGKCRFRRNGEHCGV